MLQDLIHRLRPLADQSTEPPNQAASQPLTAQPMQVITATAPVPTPQPSNATDAVNAPLVHSQQTPVLAGSAQSEAGAQERLDKIVTQLLAAVNSSLENRSIPPNRSLLNISSLIIIAISIYHTTYIQRLTLFQALLKALLQTLFHQSYIRHNPPDFVPRHDAPHHTVTCPSSSFTCNIQLTIALCQLLHALHLFRRPESKHSFLCLHARRRPLGCCFPNRHVFAHHGMAPTSLPRQCADRQN